MASRASKRWQSRARRHRYVSELDGSREPFVVYAPRGYARLARCPLVILLHGFGGDERGQIDEAVARLADERGYLLLSVRGRGNTFYDGAGENDFLRAFERTKALYRVDEDRVYLVGASMGGTGAWRLAMRHPHLFAAIVPICGWSDWRIWYRRWYAPKRRPKSVPPWRARLLDRTGGPASAASLRGVPVCILHGGRDAVVDPAESRRMYRALRKLGADATYKEFARAGHTGFRRKWRAIFDWFEGKPLRSWIGGRSAGSPSPPGVKRRKGRAAEPLRDRTGPVSVGDAFAGPFLIVAGRSAADRDEARAFARLWERWMLPRDRKGRPRGRLRVATCREVGEREIARFSLILFGRPHTNSILARIADRLPIRIGRSSVRLGRRTFKGARIGLRMVCPNPLNPERLAAVWFGRLPMRAKDLESLPWLLPQYAVFDERIRCGRTVHPDWDGWDARVAKGEIRPDEVPEEDMPPVHLPDCFLTAGFFDASGKPSV